MQDLINILSLGWAFCRILYRLRNKRRVWEETAKRESTKLRDLFLKIASVKPTKDGVVANFIKEQIG